MSISLPYVPNLTLGCIIDPPSMDRLMAMSSAMGIIDAAQDHLNAQISMKRSLEMTAQELSSMNVDTAMLIDKMRAVDASIDAAANNYAKVRVEQELALQPLRAKSGMVNASYESPVNWVRSELLPLDLGADTIKLNVQYFSFDQNVESTQNQLNNIRSFVSGSAHLLGLQVSGEMASAAVNQVNSQLQSHSIEGTLIVTATCTHRDVTMFAPLILDVDKAIRVWNQIHPDPQSRIVTNDWVMAEILEEEGTEKEMEKATLGSVIAPSVMQSLINISAAQAPIDAAQETLSSLIALRRSLDMTRQELVNLKIQPRELDERLEKVNEDITAAATRYAVVRMAQEDVLQGLRMGLPPVMAGLESPVDFNYGRTEIRQVPIAADNLKLEAQYFSFNENAQDAQNQLSKVRSFITGAFSTAGTDAMGSSFEVANAASEQISSQIAHHNIAGTLVIAATCTHRNASMLAPLYLDVDKAIRVWNSLFTSDDAKVKTDSATLAAIAEQEGRPDEPAMHIISGASYGSSFIGMVHVLRSDNMASSQAMESKAASLQEAFRLELGFAGASGGVGVDSNVSSDVKRLFSGQEINAHVSLITTGVISGMSANPVATAVKTFANSDPSVSMEALAKLADATASDKDSLEASAQAARSRELMVSMQATNVEGVLSALSDIKGENAMVMDVNSLMTAFDSYIKDINEGRCKGVPINYFVKPITRSQLAQLWVNKYFPGEFDARAGDDAEPTKRADPDGKTPPPNNPKG